MTSSDCVNGKRHLLKLLSHGPISERLNHILMFLFVRNTAPDFYLAD